MWRMVQTSFTRVLPLFLMVGCQGGMKHNVVGSSGQSNASPAPQAAPQAPGGNNGPGTMSTPGAAVSKQPMQGTFLALTSSAAQSNPAIAKLRALLVNQDGCPARPDFKHKLVSSDLGWKFHPFWGALRKHTLENFLQQQQHWLPPALLSGISKLADSLPSPVGNAGIGISSAPPIPGFADFACVVESLEIPYQSGATVTGYPVNPGNYLVMVSLEDRANAIFERGSATLSIIAGGSQTVSVALKNEKTGAAGDTITLVIAGNNHTPAVPGAGVPTQLAFTPANVTQSVNACGPVTIALEDVSNKVTTASAAETMTLASTSANGAFYSDATCSTKVTTAQLSVGASSVALYYKDSVAGAPTLSAKDGAGLNLTAASATATIQTGAASMLAFTQANLVQHVNDCGAVTIGLEDSGSNPATAASLEKVTLATTSAGGAFYSDTLCQTVITSAQIAATGSNVVVYYKDTAAGSPTLTASDNSGLALSGATETAIISAYKLVFDGNSLSQRAGVCGALTLLVEDAAGAAYLPPVAANITLATSVTTGAFYADNACTTAVTSIVMAQGINKALVYYKDTASGTPSLTAKEASGYGWTGASETAQISVASGVAFVGVQGSLKAGTCTTLTLQSQGYDGSATPVAEDISLHLSSSSATGVFYSDSACTTKVTEAVILSGAFLATVYYADTTAGATVLGAVQDVSQGWLAADQIMDIIQP